MDQAELRCRCYSSKLILYWALEISVSTSWVTCLNDWFKRGYCWTRTAGLRLDELDFTLTILRRRAYLLISFE
jgi:hypothetical protein